MPLNYFKKYKSYRFLFHLFSFCLFHLIIPSSVFAQITVVDDQGNTLHLEKKAQRIISLSPAITEMLYSAGAEKLIVGVVDYSDYPESAQKIISVGSYNSLDIEKIISLKPDLIIAWKSGNPSKQIDKLKRLGFPVFYSEPLHFKDIANNIKQFGILTGNTFSSQQQSQIFLDEIKKLKANYKNKKTISVFIHIWNKPVMTVGSKHIINQVLELCGGENIFNHEALTLTPNVEAIIQKKPELIISTGMQPQGLLWLNRWKNWEMIPAVKNNHLYGTNPNVLVRHSTRLLIGAKNICKLIDKVRNN